MKLSARRIELPFEYVFKNGDVSEFVYMAPTTEQMDRVMEVAEKESPKELLSESKGVLKENLTGDKKLIKRMLEELEKEGDIYDFKERLDIAVGKLKKKRKNG